MRAARWLVIHATLVALSLAAGLFVVFLATEYGYHPVRNAVTWAARPFAYAVSGACVQCHDPARTATALGGHEQVNCETCHGPQQEHVVAMQAAASPALPGSPSTAPGSPEAAQASPVSGGTALVVSSGAESASGTTCLVCHDAVVGRPRAFPMVSSAIHFGGAGCTLCHDPHTTAALAPPPVRHDLRNLPECLVCHGAGKVRPMTTDHPVVAGLDCLACHLRRAS